MSGFATALGALEGYEEWTGAGERGTGWEVGEDVGCYTGRCWVVTLGH